MSIEEKIGQMLMPAVPGSSINKKATSLIKKYKPGGIILFGYNYKNYNSVKKFIDDLQDESMAHSGIPLFISIDQEGGRVKRIIDGITQFPGNLAAGVSEDRTMVYRWSRILGVELRTLGINMNLAPVLDINNNPDNPVINSRSFGSDEAVVSRLGVEYIKGLQDSRCIAVGKHFPGHGDTNKDSHITLPVIKYSLERLRSLEFKPFRVAIEHGVDCIMTAHIAYPEILKSNDSATISKFFLTDILRKKLEFEGIIITDDMEMDAISEKLNMGEAAVRAIEAGADIILLSSYDKNLKKIHNAILQAVKKNVIPEERIDASVKRILEMKIRYGIISVEQGIIKQGTYVPRKEEMDLVRHAEKLNRELSRKAVYLHGSYRDLAATKTRKIIITTNEVLKKYFKPKTGFTLVDNVDELKKESALEKGTVVFYYVDKTGVNNLKKINKTVSELGLKLVILSAGNPYPVARSGIARPVLFSFSNTDESVRQLAMCIDLKFKPRLTINTNLGFQK